MIGFGRIRRGDGSFLVDDIHLDRDEAIKAFDEDGTLMGLSFLVLDGEACINDSRRK